MPIFDYQCDVCGTILKDVFVRSWDDDMRCLECSGTMTKLPAIPNMHLFPEDGIHLKHVCPGGKTFHSRNEMKKYARDNNVELGALL